MTVTYKSSIFTLELPENWTSEKDDDIHAFYSSQNDGALSISAYIIPEDYNFNQREELFEFVEGDMDSIDKEKFLSGVYHSEGNKYYYEVNDIENDRFWLYSIYYNNNVAVFVTYNIVSTSKKMEKEVEIAKNIIESIESI